MSISRPIAVKTYTVDFVPLYDASFIKHISASIFKCLNRSDANMNEPFKIAMNKGVACL